MPKQPRPINLLICFDAFGTLFKPKRPIEEQYTAIAHKFGVGLNQDGTSQFTSDDVRASFRKAFKDSAREYPNFGRAVGMGARQWWTGVINNTFIPLLPPSSKECIPPALAPALLDRFASAEAYQEPAPGLQTLFRRLRSITAPTSHHNDNNTPSTIPEQGRSKGSKPHLQFNNIVTGVITNSDDRVPDILSSFGLNVSPLRFGCHDVVKRMAATNPPPTPTPEPEQPIHPLISLYDIDFHCMSYDVGVEKPDKRIFAAAEGLARWVITLRGLHTVASSDSTSAGISTGTGSPQGQGRTSPGVQQAANGAEDVLGKDWLKIYVGDEYHADVLGALGAGWNAVWIADLEMGGSPNNVNDPVEGGEGSEIFGEMVHLDGDNVGSTSVEDVLCCPVGEKDRVGSLSNPRAVRCSSLEVLVEWLATCRGSARGH